MGARERKGVWDGHRARKLCSARCGSLDGRGAWGRMDTSVCVAESVCCPPETITALLISYTFIETKKVS